MEDYCVRGTENVHEPVSRKRLAGRYLHATCLKNNMAKPFAFNLVVVGMNCVRFVNLSTNTNIALQSSDQGRLTMRSMEIDSYGSIAIDTAMVKQHKQYLVDGVATVYLLWTDREG